MNALIVDDDSMVRKALSHRLLDSGYHVATAANGTDAISALESGNEFDIIFVDVLMPGLSGPSLLYKFKRLFTGKAPKVVIVSGLNNGEKFLRELQTPFDYFVPKPIDFGYLNSILEKIS